MFLEGGGGGGGDSLREGGREQLLLKAPPWPPTEHPLGSPTTSTFGVFRCDSLGVVRSNSVFTSPLLGSPGRQPLLQPSIHETSSYRAVEKGSLSSCVVRWNSEMGFRAQT